MLLSALTVAPAALQAQTATQVVTFSVVSSSRVAIGSATLPLQASSMAPDASSRTGATVAGTSYAVATNEKNQKISASLDAPVPRGLALSVALGAPHGAVSRGLRPLGTTPTDVVTGIGGSDEGALPVTYRWNATSVAALKNRIVTYTITAGL